MKRKKKTKENVRIKLRVRKKSFLVLLEETDERERGDALYLIGGFFFYDILNGSGAEREIVVKKEDLEQAVESLNSLLLELKEMIQGIKLKMEGKDVSC